MSFFDDVGDFFSDAGQAIVGAVAIVAGAATGQAWLVGIGVSLEISFISGKLEKKQDTPVGGAAEQVSYDPTEIDKLAVGYAWSMGSFVDEFTHDFLPGGGGNEGKNRVKEKVVALFDYHCSGLVEIWNGTTQLTIGAFDPVLGFPIQEYVTNGKCHLWIKFYEGAWGQIADAHLIAVSGGRYTSTDTGWGRCYVRITSVAAQDSNDQVWAGGEPQLKFVVMGAALYNPAKDSTVGGDGSHRWGDYSTYEWSDNEPLIRYNVCRGFYMGNGQLFYGIGCTHDEVRFADAVNAIAIADEDVPLKSGATQKRYRAGGTIEVNVAPRDVLKSLADASAGRNITVAGQYRLFVGAYNIPVGAFTGTDVQPAEDYEDDPKVPGDSLINAVYGTYTERSEGWVTKSLPVRRSSDDIAEDGSVGERSLTLSTGFLLDYFQGQRVMEIMRRRARAQISLVRTLPPIFYQYEPGDTLAATLTRLGYTDMAFYVRNVQVDNKVNVTFSLQQDPATIYTWDADTDELPISGGALPSGDPPSTLIPSGFTLTTGSDAGPQGAVIPRVSVTWDDPQDPSVTGLTVEYRQAGSDQSSYLHIIDFVAGVAQLDALLLPGANYEARLIFETLTGRAADWSDWSSFVFPPSMILPAGVDPISDLLMRALSPVASVRDAIAGSVFFPWLNTMEQTFAATAQAAADLHDLHGVVRDAGITRDPATGVVVISAVDAVSTELQSYKTTVSATFDAVNASIALNVSQVQFNQGLAAVAAGFTPAYRYEFNSSAEGWTASNATLSASASVLTYTGTGASPYLQSPVLTLAAAANPLVQIKLNRSAGTAWGMAVQWGGAFQFSQPITAPTDPTQPNVVQADMTGNPDWTGSIPGIRIAIGDASSVFQIDYIAIGQSALQALVVGDLSQRITDVSATLSLLAGDVSTKASSVSVQDLTARMGLAETDIDANTASITSKASQASLDDTNTSLTSVQSRLDAQAGQIEQVLSFASGQTAVGQAASPEQLGANIASALAGFVQRLSELDAKVEYARQGLYADVGLESAARLESVRELQVAFGDSSAQFLEVVTATADGLSAEVDQREAGLAAITASTTAGFLNESNARVAGDSANASNISTVTTTVNNHTTSISSILSSVNGVSAQWGVQINGNGAVTGVVRLDGGASHSSFTIVANDLLYYDPTNGATPLFTISGGVALFQAPLVAGLINASTIIADNVITKNKIQANQITSFAVMSRPSPDPAPAGWAITGTEANPYGTGQRLNVDYDSNAKVLISFAGSFTRQGGHSPTVTLRLWKYTGVGTDSVLAEAFSGGSGVAANQPFVVTYCDKSPVNVGGSAQYYLTSFSDDASVTVNNGVFWAMSGQR